MRQTHRLGHIRRHGNRVSGRAMLAEAAEGIDPMRRANVIGCRDGFRFSVIAGYGTRCAPRPDWHDVPDDYPGPYREVEVGLYTPRIPHPRPVWRRHFEGHYCPNIAGCVFVYNYVPVSLVYGLIKHHGGEVLPAGDPYNVAALATRVLRNRDRQLAALHRAARRLDPTWDDRLRIIREEIS